MRDDKRNYVLVGAFVVAMLAALILWIALLSGRTGATDDYYIVYDNVMGLKTGLEILYEGYPVGRIEDIHPVERDGRQSYRVDVAVKRGWPIPVDSRAAITAPGLLSSVVVDIRSGSSAELLAPGSEIPGEEAGDMLAAVNSAARQLGTILEEGVKPLVAELARGAPAIVGNLEGVTDQLDDAIERVGDLLSPDNVERVSQILANLDGATGEFEHLVKELSNTRATVDGMIGRVNRLLDEEEGDVHRALRELNYSLAAVSRHIEAIASNLEATTRNMNEFTRHIRNDPGLLVRGREQGEEP